MKLTLTNLTLWLTGLALASAGVAQDTERGLAITNARLLPISGPAIERGTLLVRRGKIEALGDKVAVPPGYDVVDAQGGTVMPGAVSANSHAGLQSASGPREERPNAFRRGGGRGRGRGPEAPPSPGGEANRAGEKVVAQIYARHEAFENLLRNGITTLGIAPLGRGLPGQGAVLRPRGADAAAMTIVPAAFQTVSPNADTRTKDLLRRALEDGKRALERRKRRAEAPKPEEAKPAEAPKDAPKPAGESAENKPAEKPVEKPADKPAETPPTRPAQPEVDIHAEAIADLLDGKTRALVQLDSATEMAHYLDTVKAASFPVVVIARRHANSSMQGLLDLTLDKLKTMKASVLLTPDLSTLPNTEYLVNLPARLLAAGIETGFLLPDSGRALAVVRAQLIELVRSGLPADAALRGITLVPAKALGVDKLVGTLEPGKSANLLLWSADPLDPIAELRSVWLEGARVEEVGQ
jgi:hypothetical protein